MKNLIKKYSVIIFLSATLIIQYQKHQFFLVNNVM